jgi:ComF family protein
MDGMRAVCSHEGMIRKLVHDLKYRHARSLAAWGGEVLYRSLSSRPVTVDAIVPVPLAPRRQRERGYNQSELLGRELAARWGVPVETTVLRRVRETPPQVGKSAAERRANVRGAFACIEGAPVTDRRILLVDDVATTGATLNACAEPLKAAGATRVVGLVLAKGMLTPGDVRL